MRPVRRGVHEGFAVLLAIACGGGSPAALQRISFVTNRDGNNEVYTMNIDGSDPRRVTGHPDNDFASSWTSDGMRLIFDTERNGHWDIYAIGLDGTNEPEGDRKTGEDREKCPLPATLWTHRPE